MKQKWQLGLFQKVSTTTMTFNPLNPNWRWHIISPDSITLKSNIKVARIEEMITNQRRRTNYPSQHLRKCKENAYRCIRRKERQVLLVHNLNSRVTWLWWCLFLIKTSVNVTVNSSSKDSPHRGDHITQDQLFSAFLPKLIQLCSRTISPQIKLAAFKGTP